MVLLLLLFVFYDGMTKVNVYFDHHHKWGSGAIFDHKRHTLTIRDTILHTA